MEQADFFAVKSARDIPVRPLNKGMILNTAANAIPAGGFLDLRNYLTTPAGIRRRPGYLAFGAGTPDDDEIYGPFQDIAVFWIADGTQYTCMIDDKFLYTVDTAGALTRKTWEYTKAVNVTVAGTTVTAAADAEWDDAGNEVKAGDVIAYDTAGTAKFGTIASVDSALQLTLTESPGAYGPAAAWHIRKAFGATKPLMVDWTVTPDGEILFADGARHLYSFDGTTFTDFQSANSEIPTCVCYFDERIWMGRITDGGSEERQKIMWSEAGDYDDFTNGGYVNLPYAQGAVVRLIPIGRALMAYMEDAIFVGTPSNDVNNPLVFNKYETGGLGLVGPKAACAWSNMHFLILQDNIYSFSLNNGLRPIGDAIVREAIQSSSEDHLWKARAVPDIRNKCILFGLPKGSDRIEEVWAYNYETGAWSHYPISMEMLASADIVALTAWSGLATTWATEAKKWIDYVPKAGGMDRVYFSFGEVPYRFTAEGKLDDGDSSVPAVIITPDYDLNYASANKTWLDFGLKLDTPPSDDVNFTIRGSVDRGVTWKDLGTIPITTTTTEGRVSFRLTGAHARFEITCLDPAVPYVIAEYTMRVRAVGKEIPGRDT